MLVLFCFSTNKVVRCFLFVLNVYSFVLFFRQSCKCSLFICSFGFVLFSFSNIAVGILCLFVYVFVCFIFSNKAVGVLGLFVYFFRLFYFFKQSCRCSPLLSRCYHCYCRPQSAPKDRPCEGYFDKYYNIELVLWDLRKG